MVVGREEPPYTNPNFNRLNPLGGFALQMERIVAAMRQKSGGRISPPLPPLHCKQKIFLEKVVLYSLTFNTSFQPS